MTRLFAAVGGLVLVAALGGGAWLAVSPMQPASHTVRAALPDTFPR